MRFECNPSTGVVTVMSPYTHEELITHAERLEALAKLHDMQPPELLDQGRWFYRHDVNERILDDGRLVELPWIDRCGTPSCSGGWACTIFDKLAEQMAARINDNAIPQIIGRWFGLDPMMTDWLFGSEPRTPSVQAGHLRHAARDKRTL